MEASKLLELKNGNYYHLINKSTGNALTYLQQDDKLILDTPDDNDLKQIFMIEEVQQFKFEVVHALSTLVLTRQSDSSIKLSFGKQSSNQLFFVHKSDPKNHPDEYWIKENKKSSKCIVF